GDARGGGVRAGAGVRDRDRAGLGRLGRMAGRARRHRRSPGADGGCRQRNRTQIKVMDISDDEDAIGELLRSTKRVAVLGMKMEPHQPAFYVPKYLAGVGVEVVPVPVYYPGVTEILGRPVYRKVADVPGPIDIVHVF